jgi:hypothetical protein
MVKRVAPSLLGAIVFLCVFSPAPARAQACEEEDAMIRDYRQSLTELVETVRKESLEQFQRAYRQKSCLNRLTFFLLAFDPVVECLEKAAAAPGTPKAQAAALREKRESYVKLKAKIEEYRDSLKKAGDDKAAKAVIEKFELVP